MKTIKCFLCFKPQVRIAQTAGSQALLNSSLEESGSQGKLAIKLAGRQVNLLTKLLDVMAGLVEQAPDQRKSVLVRPVQC